MTTGFDQVLAALDNEPEQTPAETTATEKPAPKKRGRPKKVSAEPTRVAAEEAPVAVEGEAEPVEAAPGAAVATKPPAKPRIAPKAFIPRATTPKQRGKRADEDFVQVNGFLRKGYHASLHYYAKEDDIPISELIGRLLQEYVDSRGGVLGARSKRR